MRHALADDVVEGDEAALRAECRADGRADRLDPREQRADQPGRKVRQRHVVLPGGDQHVALEYRPDVEEGHRDLVGQHDVRWPGARDDLAEQAIGHPGTVACPSWRQRTDGGMCWRSAGSPARGSIRGCRGWSGTRLTWPASHRRGCAWSAPRGATT